jgi:hypothetical protein
MVRKLRAKDITISETPDRRDLKILSEDNAMVDMLEFVEKTEVARGQARNPMELAHGMLNDSTRVRMRKRGEAADDDVA